MSEELDLNNGVILDEDLRDKFKILKYEERALKQALNELIEKQIDCRFKLRNLWIEIGDRYKLDLKDKRYKLILDKDEADLILTSEDDPEEG